MKHSLLNLSWVRSGGVARLLLNNLVTGTLAGGGFPWGILTINVLGSTAIGVGRGLVCLSGRRVYKMHGCS